MGIKGFRKLLQEISLGSENSNKTPNYKEYFTSVCLSILERYPDCVIIVDAQHLLYVSYYSYFSCCYDDLS